MDSLQAFAMGEANRGKEQMVFDWDKAAKIIKERKPEVAAAGLRSDWEYTGDIIYKDGKPVKNSDCYIASTWVVPELAVDGDIIECYRMASDTPGWDADTLWPKTALEILQAEDIKN